MTVTSSVSTIALRTFPIFQGLGEKFAELTAAEVFIKDLGGGKFFQMIGFIYLTDDYFFYVSAF